MSPGGTADLSKLRYRMMPYIYSLAWRVTSHDDTIQRPLVMDWRKDQKIWNIGDEFMFGPSIEIDKVLPFDGHHTSLKAPQLRKPRSESRSSV